MPILIASIISISTLAATVEYRVFNDSSFTIYVFDRLYAAPVRGVRAVDPALAYVTTEGDQIIVGKFLLPVPRGLKVETPDIPYLAAVGPGDTLVGKIVLPLPLKIWNPYVERDAASLNLYGSAREIVIRLGYIDGSVMTKDRPVVYQSPGGVICDYGYGIEFQQMLDKTLTLQRP